MGVEAGKSEWILTTLGNSPILLLSDRNSKPRAIPSMTNGNPSLVTVDENGTPMFTAA